MRRSAKAVLVIGAAAAAVLAAPVAAWAKGPSQATIAGPGLASPVTIGGAGEPGSGGRLADLAEGTGLFAAMFGQTPDPMLPTAPTKYLGPRYTVTYLVPGGATDARIEQALFPSAAGGPVSYLAPGQTFFDDQRTRGGWYRGSPALLATLRALGIEAAAASAARPAAAGYPAQSPHPPAVQPVAASSSRRLPVAWAAAAFTVLLLGSVAATRRRARSRRTR